MSAPADSDEARAFLLAAAAPGPRAALEALYADVRDAIARRAPACWASGRCCNFAASGHRLYATGLEAAYALSPMALGEAVGQGSSAGPLAATDASGAVLLTLPQVAAARARGDCPFLAANLCAIHDRKPLACRTFFCDRTARAWQEDLTERSMSRLRAIHDEHAIPYRYREWREHLEALTLARAGGGA